MALDTTRRGFLKGATAMSGALLIGFDAQGQTASEVASVSPPFALNPFVALNADGTVTVIAKHFEMGQGTTTGLATLVAEELDAAWDQIRVAWAPADNARYANLLMGVQGTAGSTAIANSYMQYRQAGAAARAVMVQAAAALWGAPESAVTLAEGRLSGPEGQSAAFADLIEPASKITPPADPALKDASAFRLIGRADLPRYDSAEKTDGSAQFALDLRIPNMVMAVVARPPRFGGALVGFDAAAARAVRGVVDVKAISRGVVVYATSTWAAIKGREALEIEWDFSAAENRSSDEIMAVNVAALDEPGLPARNDGDAAAEIAGAAAAGGQVVAAEFEFPFLAHAPMETENCVLAVEGDKVTVWDGCQFPSLVQPTMAQVLGVPPENVTIHTVYAGGSFGRRATPISDYQLEAALAAQALGDGRPVKLVWTREDDIQGGYYRPMFAHRVTAALDADGRPTAWDHRIAGKSIMIGTAFESFVVKDGIDHTSVEGASDLPYAIPNVRVDVRNTETQVPVLWWRAVGHTHTAYAKEVAMDMLARAAGRDPIDFRLGLLDPASREAGVLRLAAESFGWGSSHPKRSGRGVALHKSFNTYVAVIVEVSRDGSDYVKLDRAVVAVDSGQPVNPDVIKAQMEGGAAFGFGAVMRNQITLTEGQVDQTNFWDYEPIRMSDTPKIEVAIMPSTEAPTGVGEPATPPAGPALANALADAFARPSDTHVTKLPMTAAGVLFAYRSGLKRKALG